jgi:hypothetical protein
MSRPFTPVPKPEPRAKKPKTRIKPVSTKQAKALTEYAKVRKEFLAEHLYCEAKLEGCQTVASDVHHTAGRGTNLSNADTFLAVCRTCHRFIEDNPTEALKMGFSKSRLHE